MSFEKSTLSSPLAEYYIDGTEYLLGELLLSDILSLLAIRKKRKPSTDEALNYCLKRPSSPLVTNHLQSLELIKL